MIFYLNSDEVHSTSFYHLNFHRCMCKLYQNSRGVYAFFPPRTFPTLVRTVFTSQRMFIYGGNPQLTFGFALGEIS